MDEKKATLLEHLSDLRSCLIRALIGVVIAMIACYGFVEHILQVLKAPMLEAMRDDFSLVVLSPQEYFFTELKAALFFGLVLSCPWVFLQVWRFVAPGLYRHERRTLVLFVMAASTSFVLGISFAYFAVFPPTFKFFIESLPAGITGAYSVGMLYSFAITILMAFGFIFQTPIAIFMLVMFDLISIETLSQYRRVVLVAAFVIGAILTPPDPITQVMLAVPAYGLFELGLLFARIMLKRRSATSA